MINSHDCLLHVHSMILMSVFLLYKFILRREIYNSIQNKRKMINHHFQENHKFTSVVMSSRKEKALIFV